MLENENGIHFISAPTFDRINVFQNDQHCLLLEEQLRYYADAYDVELLAYVIMPDHLHCLIWPQGEKTFSDYMRGIKSFSAKKIIEVMHRWGAHTPFENNHRRGAHTPPPQKVWQDSFFTYLISSIQKLEEKLEYIRQNPVEAGLVATPEAYRWLYVNPYINEIQF